MVRPTGQKGKCAVVASVVYWTPKFEIEGRVAPHTHTHKHNKSEGSPIWGKATVKGWCMILTPPIDYTLNSI